jgi:methionyl-tRNA formyltransferase
MRLAFAGTPEFAAQALGAIHAAGHELTLVLTQPDRPAGRGMRLQSSAVKQLALRLGNDDAPKGAPIAQPRGLRLDGRFGEDAASARHMLEAARPDVMVVAAYGLILPAWVLALPAHGCLNIHASLLPRWRGAAPIQRAIEAGDETTGITIMQMDAGLDTGDMLLVASEPIRPDDTAATLHDRLAALGARQIVLALAALQMGTLKREPQPEHGATYAHKIGKAEAPIDWRQSAAAIERRLRAFDPFPGATLAVPGETVKVWRGAVWTGGTGAPATVAAGSLVEIGAGRLAVACGEGVLELLELQRPGGRRVGAAQFLQSPSAAALQPGCRLELPG